MTDDVNVQIDNVSVEPKATPAGISMPDHAVRMSVSYQLYVRLGRPTLDWVTVGAVYYHMIAQPFWMGKFDVVAAGMSLAWAAAVYGIKTYEKKAGVA